MCLFHQPLQYSIHTRTHKHFPPHVHPVILCIRPSRTAHSWCSQSSDSPSTDLDKSPPQHNRCSKTKHPPPNQGIHLCQLDRSSRGNDTRTITQSAEFPGLWFKGTVPSRGEFPALLAIPKSLSGTVFSALATIPGGVFPPAVATALTWLEGLAGASSGFKTDCSAKKSVC